MGVALAESPQYNLRPPEKLKPKVKNKLEVATEDWGDANDSGPKVQDVRETRVRKRPRPLVLTSIEEDEKRRKKWRIGNVEDAEVPFVNRQVEMNRLSPTKLGTQSQEKLDKSVPDTEGPSQMHPIVAEEGSPEERELRPDISSTSVIPGHERHETQLLNTWASPGCHSSPNGARWAPLPTPYSPYTNGKDLVGPLSSRIEISHSNFFRGAQSAPASTTSFERSDPSYYRGGLQPSTYYLEPPFQYSPREAGVTPAHFPSAGVPIPNLSVNLNTSNEVLGNGDRNLDMLATTAVSNPNNRSQYPFDLVEIVRNIYLGSYSALLLS